MGSVMCNKPLSVSVSVDVCPCRDISRVVSYYVDTILYTFFPVGLLPRFQSHHYIHYRQLYQNFKKCSIKRDTIKIATLGL